MSKSENNGTVPSGARVCHVIKQENFDGYGFNLHAEKGKPGQYIGKVDEGSPAETAGLKQGDRILEVNGSSIFNESHKQVVQRIKAISNEVQLLVIDPSAVTVSNKDKTGTESPVKAEADSTDSPTSNEKISTSSSVNSPSKASISESPSTTTTIIEHENKPEINSQPSTPPAPVPPPPPPSANVNHESTNNSISTTNSSVPANNHSANANNTVTNNSKSEGLNLNMTAAELRAKLAAKKKFDPKNESVDLRKKFEIIQKL